MSSLYSVSLQLHAPELFAEGGELAFFTSRGSVLLGFNKKGTWPSSCLVQQVWSSLWLLPLIHVHVLKRKKMPYWIWKRTRTNKFLLLRRGRMGYWRGLPQPGGCRALQPLGGGLCREAQRLRRVDDRPGDCELRHGRSPRWRTLTPPSGGREGSGAPVFEHRVLVGTSRQVVWLFASDVKWDLMNSPSWDVQCCVHERCKC